MLLQVAIISLQVAALAAFLTLWYFWVKKKLLCSYLLEDEEQILFPFRYFSWVLLGVVLVSAIVHVHFVRTSTQLHERLLEVTAAFRAQEQALAAVQEIRQPLDQVRREVSHLAANVKDFGLRQQMVAAVPAAPASLSAPVAGPSARPDSGEKAAPVKRERISFNTEAKASSSKQIRTAALAPVEKPASEDDQGFSMKLNLAGRVTVDKLRVRQQPNGEAPVVERLPAGESVKVTEKRLYKDAMWFRVVTPSGRTGWVDYRFIKLEGQA